MCNLFHDKYSIEMQLYMEIRLFLWSILVDLFAFSIKMRMSEEEIK